MLQGNIRTSLFFVNQIKTKITGKKIEYFFFQFVVDLSEFGQKCKILEGRK